MSIEPVVRCADIEASIRFYTEVLDFTVAVPNDPDKTSHKSKRAILERGGGRLHLSSHGGDGAFGCGVYVRVEDVDALFALFVSRGLNRENKDRPPALRGGPVDQSWGMREFWLHDPDRNIVTFGHRLP